METISIIIPCYNEEEAIPVYYETMVRQMNEMEEQQKVQFELIFVDDGSKDHSLFEMRRLAQKDMRCRYLSFSRNFGKEAAMYAGLQAAKGDYVTVMDVDLQDPPFLLPKMYAMLQSGTCDCVAARRSSREGEGKIKSFLSNAFYSVINRLSKTEIVSGARDYRLMSRKMVDAVRGNVIRPLLCVGRKEIRQELESRKCSWCEDSTNAEDAYTRNGIRHHVLPYLTEEVNPRAAAHMAQTSLDLLETEEYLEQQTDQLMERYASAEKNAVVLRDAVSSEAPLLQRYVIRRVLEQLAGKRKDLTREHLESVRELFEKQVGKSVCLPYGITAVRGYETLRLEKQGVHLKEERKRKSGEEVPIPVPAGWEEEKSLTFAENPVTIVKKTSVFPERIEEKKYTKCFDCDKIKDGLVLRTRRSGDYLRVTAKGGKKKLKDYMIDAKIPKEERDSILLLADGPEIWWVVGYRRGESGRVGEDTKAVLQIQIGVGKEENR